MALVYKHPGFWGFLDKKNHPVVPCQYTQLRPFREGVSAAALGLASLKNRPASDISPIFFVYCYWIQIHPNMAEFIAILVSLICLIVFFIMASNLSSIAKSSRNTEAILRRLLEMQKERSGTDRDADTERNFDEAVKRAIENRKNN